MHPEVVAVTERLRERSRVSRAAYLVQMAQAPAGRSGLSCGNLAHGMAACSAQDKARIRMIDEVNIGMVSGLLPVVGVPLPLVSYGGTSSVTLMAAFGVLMSIHTHRRMITA